MEALKSLSRLDKKDVDKERLRTCRKLGFLKDRHRGNGGKNVALELVDGLIDEFVEEDERDILGHWSNDI